jgi:hypothetical protein
MERPPEPTTSDRIHSLAKAAISAVPTIGGPGAEVFSAFFSAPLERRRQRWLVQLAAVIEQLVYDQETTVERLQGDERFVSAVLAATQVALRHASDDRIVWLRNGLVNIASSATTEAELDMRMIRLADQLEPSHVRLLAFLDQSRAQIATIQTYEELYRLVKSDLDWDDLGQGRFRVLCEDLSTQSLIRVSPHVSDYGDVFQPDFVTVGAEEARTTISVSWLGEEFLSFISSAGAD